MQVRLPAYTIGLGPGSRVYASEFIRQLGNGRQQRSSFGRIYNIRFARNVFR